MNEFNNTSIGMDTIQKSALSSPRDYLTGLYNKEFFQKQLESFDNERNYPLSVIICEINGLQLINRILGSEKGDLLIFAAAKAIRGCIRKNDLAAWVDGRLIILFPCTCAADARLIEERIKAACRRESETAKSPCVNLLTGFAAKTSARQDITAVLSDAEKDLNRSRQAKHQKPDISTLEIIRKGLSTKSHETEEHAQRLIRHSTQLGLALGLSGKQLARLESLAAYHDIGKASIPAGILTKPGPLNEQEWSIIRKHPEEGFRIAVSIPYLKDIAEATLCHHERWDGKGYPRALSGDDIPLLSRIIAVVDTFDAITSKRCYRDAVSVKKALKEIKRNSGTQFDPIIAKTFIKLKKREKRSSANPLSKK